MTQVSDVPPSPFYQFYFCLLTLKFSLAGHLQDVIANLKKRAVDTFPMGIGSAPIVTYVAVSTAG
jgi:hypothetical protein